MNVPRGFPFRVWMLLVVGLSAGASRIASEQQAGQQAGQLQARHEAGQTRLTFREVDPPVAADATAGR